MSEFEEIVKCYIFHPFFFFLIFGGEKCNYFSLAYVNIFNSSMLINLSFHLEAVYFKYKKHQLFLHRSLGLVTSAWRRLAPLHCPDERDHVVMVELL
jgi:hypothetical protein